MTYCEDCGCKVYNGRCTNCDEELFILDQYEELGMTKPDEDSEFMRKARESKERIESRRY